jgi:ABC-type antimicrobial peptide transport system permease subunit
VLIRTAGRSAAVGAVIGLMLAIVGGSALQGFLYGLSPLDPGAYFVVTVLVVATGWAATIIPFRKALRVSPAIALKQL